MVNHVASAELQLRDAKRVAQREHGARSDTLNLYRAKQTGRVLAMTQHAKELSELYERKQQLVHAVKYHNIQSYMADSRVDDFLAYKKIQDDYRTTCAKIDLFEHGPSVSERWNQQVSQLEPDHVGSIAVLNHATGNVQESFPIDPERCKCGRVFHFNATLSMNFCSVHKIYSQTFATNDESGSKKAKQPIGNYTNNSTNVKMLAKQPRLIITSNNQICAANNPLYQERLQHVQDDVLRLTTEIQHHVFATQKRSAKPKQAQQRKPRTPRVETPPKPPRKPKQTKKSTRTIITTSKAEPKQSEEINDKKTATSNLVKQLCVSSSSSVRDFVQDDRKDAVEQKQKSGAKNVSNSTKRKFLETRTPEVLSNNKKANVRMEQDEKQSTRTCQAYETYLQQFAPDAAEITSAMSQELHKVVGNTFLFGSGRCNQEITSLVDTHDAFRNHRFQIDRILKITRGLPVPVIDAELRNKLLLRFAEVQCALFNHKDDGAVSSKRKFVPSYDMLTHVFLMSERKWHLATAFVAYENSKIADERTKQFRDLLTAVQKTSSLTWMFDFELTVDIHNHRMS